MDLVVMAAGMGSRFGGLKQIQPVDSNGNFIIDYSIYDAIKAGFDRVVFVIKKENLNDFKNTIGKRLEPFIKVDYVFQENSSFLNKNQVVLRTKPWGTAHAILCTKEKVSSPFAVINADDFYGRNSFLKIAEFLKNLKNENDFAMIGFHVSNTLTETGEVKRGVCNIKDGNLIGIKESKIKRAKDNILSSPVDKDEYEVIDSDRLVSMNLFGFTPKLFDFLQKGFEDFLEENKDNLLTCEYYIPTILTRYINEKIGDLKVFETDEKWYGLTYKEDFDYVSQGIKELIQKNIYPINLWE